MITSFTLDIPHLQAYLTEEYSEKYYLAIFTAEPDKHLEDYKSFEFYRQVADYVNTWSKYPAKIEIIRNQPDA